MSKPKTVKLQYECDLSRLKSALSRIHRTIRQIPDLQGVAAGLAVAVRELENAEARATRDRVAPQTGGNVNQTRH